MAALRFVTLLLWAPLFSLTAWNHGATATSSHIATRDRGEKKWGDQCNDTLQCGYDNALCTDGQRRVCACHLDFPATNKIDKCDVSRVINQTCAFNEQCEMAVPRTECRGGRCACHFGMAPQQTNKTWSCRSVLGSPCNATHVCHQDDSDKHALQCYKGKCQCKGIFMPEDKMCKKKIDMLGAKCTDTDICYADSEGPRRQCTNGSCQCKSSFVIENAVCKQKINLLGAPCNATVDVCYLDEDGNQQKRHCKDGVCQCKAEFTLTSDKKCQKLKSGNNHAEARFVGRLAWIPLIAVISVIR